MSNRLLDSIPKEFHEQLFAEFLEDFSSTPEKIEEDENLRKKVKSLAKVLEKTTSKGTKTEIEKITSNDLQFWAKSHVFNQPKQLI